MNTILEEVLSIISLHYGPQLRFVRSGEKAFLIGKVCTHTESWSPETLTGYVAQFFASELKELRMTLTQVPEMVFEQEIDGRTKVLSPLQVFCKETRRNIVRELQDLKTVFRKLEKVCEMLETFNAHGFAEPEQYFYGAADLENDIRQRFMVIQGNNGNSRTCPHAQRLCDILKTIPTDPTSYLRLTTMH